MVDSIERYCMTLHEKMVSVMGFEPLNPIGKCFETTAAQVFSVPSGMRVCHGIGLSNIPDEESMVMGHAWLEDLEGYAYDTTWGTRTPAKDYREQLGLKYVVEYSVQEFIANWKATDYPGPWDKQIRAVMRS